MPDEKVLASGQVERIGLAEQALTFKRPDGYKFESKPKLANHAEALKAICDKLTDPKNGVIKSLKEVEAIGHRVLNCGETYSKPELVDEKVKQVIRDCFPIGPLHNPPNLSGIEACEGFFPGVPNVIVIDTAFHQTMPPEAYLYAIPTEYYKKYGIRRYGFHGTSHNFVAHATAEFLKRPYDKLNIITCHLGNGCSMAAIQDGKVIDTTMGLTPLEGLMMGTRSGDVDPAVVFNLAGMAGMSIKDIDTLLNKKSGLLAVAGIGSGDMRDVIEAANSGNEQAKLALKMFVRRVVKYVGAYFTLIEGGAEALVFTGGIGEWSDIIRGLVMASLKPLGIAVDDAKNKEFRGKAGVISTADSKWKAIVMPTNEELMISRSVVQVLKEKGVAAV
jgi:acetate kinase